MFLETEDGYVNMAHIVTIKNGAPGNYLAKLVNEETVMLKWTRDYFIKYTSPAFASLPGFELLSAYVSDGNAKFDREPIIGWRLNDFGGVEPIVADWEETTITDNMAVKGPDGKVRKVSGGQYESEQLWLDEIGKGLAAKEGLKAAS